MAMSDEQQLPLFDKPPDETDDIHGEPPPSRLDHLTPLNEAVEIYLDTLRLGGASLYTIKAFKSDLNLLGRWAGHKRAVGAFATHDLNKFLHWLVAERSEPCSPKSYARRITTLKNFFGYLHSEGVIAHDPAAPLIQEWVSSPLPAVLLESEIERVLGVTQRLRRRAEGPDARPHLLVTLLLQTGIKKSECMAIRPDDISRADPAMPVLWVRYEAPHMRYKERKIPLKPEWLDVLDEYMEQRKPPREIFNCTARNLEYVLRDVANRAGVSPQKLSFETLRWTCALRDWRNGMEPERLRQKLGLSRISWRETLNKLEKLAEER
jgi:site-specific recombinase XerD